MFGLLPPIRTQALIGLLVGPFPGIRERLVIEVRFGTG
jgi:hypothetical protein